MNPKEIYVSTDVETDGPIPGPHSMLSFGSVALLVEDGRAKCLGEFARNLEPLEGARGHPDTMAWWMKNRAAYDQTRQNTKTPFAAMQEYVVWLKELEKQASAKVVFVGYPASFDFLFVYWYLIQFADQSPFSFSALDIKTLAMGKLGIGFRETSKKTMPKEWFGSRPHTHNALDDAWEQGDLFCRIMGYEVAGELGR